MGDTDYTRRFERRDLSGMKKTGNSQLAFYYGDERIAFERVKRQDHINRILIKVHPDCRVQIAAPENSSNAEVISAAKKRARWIYQQLRDFKAQQQHVIPKRYLSGESHYYLGKRYLLKIEEAPADMQQVKLLRGKIEVFVRRRSSERAQQLLQDWYKAKAKEVFSQRLDAVLEKTLWIKERPPIRIQTMKKQWGSCSPSGRITLNPHLVKASKECIDYVILHELCHIAEHNHSDRFYRLMSQVMPRWEQTKERLDKMAGAFID